MVCAGHPIRSIRIYPRPGVTADDAPFAPVIRRLTDALSWETRPRTVLGELRFRPGDLCDPGQLAESERILRAQPYIRSAAIVTTPATGDSIDVEVTTRDEWSLGGSVRFDTESGKGIKAARITESNFLGRGVFGQLRYDYFGRRAGLVVEVAQPEVFKHSDAGFVVGRTSVGPVGELSLRRAFESEYDRFAWRTAARWRQEPFLFRSALYGTVVQPLVSAGIDVGVLYRWGPVGRQFIFGVSVSHERLFTTDGVLASQPSLDSAAASTVAGRFNERRRLALNLVAGLRSIRFVPRLGVDAVNAPEDVREGFELRVVGGAAFGYMAGLQEDRFGLVDLFVGTSMGPTLTFLRARAEGRWLPDLRRWENVIGTADVFTYTPVGSRGVLVVGLQGAGGWTTTVPFQLIVAGPTALRGYGYSGKPGGRRVVAQAEHRYFLGTVLGVMDFGSALFLDVGRGWAGDAAFGENTPTLVAIGAGVRAAFPSGSKITARVDFAVPLTASSGAELRFTLRQQFGIGRIEAVDVERSRQPVSTIALIK